MRINYYKRDKNRSKMTSLNAFEDEEQESSYGFVFVVSGSVVTADKMSGSAMYTLVPVGYFQLVGEINHLEGDMATIQVYKDTSGVIVGDPISSTGKPLSVELGPGILGSIYNGILRLLKYIIKLIQNIYVPMGVNIPALGRNVSWDYNTSNIKIRSHITGVDLWSFPQKYSC